MNQTEVGDVFLEEQLANYDQWLREGKIPFSSRVIPVQESINTQQWVLPTEQVDEFLRNARSFALKMCGCRSRYQRCDNPLEVCFLLNDAADQYIAAGEARRVCLAEARAVLRQANEHGLIHLTFYSPDQYVFAICSCCICCCHDLQLLRLYDRKDLIARSEYVAHTNDELCIHCGVCVDRCEFGARVLEDGFVIYLAQACYGCGLCVSSCSPEAMVMKRRIVI
jgi:ferredoxin